MHHLNRYVMLQSTYKALAMYLQYTGADKAIVIIF